MLPPRTTLVTLKARKGALGMAMGVLHEGHAGELRTKRCCGCRGVVSVPAEWVDQRAVCARCAKGGVWVPLAETAGVVGRECASCDEEFFVWPGDGRELCAECDPEGWREG